MDEDKAVGIDGVTKEEYSRNLYISWLYALLFQRKERKVQSKEENQQEEVKP